MYQKLFSLAILLLMSSVAAKSQLIDEQQLSHENFLRRVVSIESFIDRFNLEEDQKGNAVEVRAGNFNESFIKERTYSILSLFDIENANKAVGDEQNNIISFVKQVNNLDSQTKLNFYDSNWYAEIECNAQYRKQKKKVTLILKNQKNKNGGSKWVIQSAYADFLRLEPKSEEKALSIPPNSHGTDFIGVPTALNDSKNAVMLSASGFSPDPLSMFLYAVYNEDLILQETTRVQYHFLQIKGWVVLVKEFNRNTPNSGWLIEKLIKTDESGKVKYLKGLLGGDKAM